MNTCNVKIKHLCVDVKLHRPSNQETKPERQAELISEVKVKGKAIQLQTLTGPEVSRRFRLPDFKTIGT
jgi:hypothetical protein